MIVSFSKAWRETSLLDFLKQGQGQPRVYWANESLELEMAGYGQAAFLRGRDQQRFSSLDRQVRHLFEHARTEGDSRPELSGPRLFGGFQFDASRADAIWSDFPDGALMLPGYLLIRSGSQYVLTLSRYLDSAQDAQAALAEMQREADDLLWQGTGTTYDSPMVDAPGRLQRQDCGYQELTDRDEWIGMTRTAIETLADKDLDKVVLARAVELTMQSDIGLGDILAQLRAQYPDCYRFLFEFQPGSAFIGATPELLAATDENKLHTHALAGSIPRGITWDEDHRLGQALLESPKERLEHDLVVQEIRRNLTPVTDELAIPETPELVRFTNIQHLMTPVRGTLANGSGLLKVVEMLHPTPALGGTPRARALQVIDELENTPRGWYGAPIGWIGPSGQGQFAVGIRSALARGRRFRLYAGAGIVAESQPALEWAETEIKLRPMLNALGVTA
jgi:menaquinone-specific isochorismate synthase